MYGFHNRGDQQLPDWAGTLIGHYWRVRVEGRDKAKKRKYYRYIAKEKLKLAEQGIDQTVIIALCKYLANLNVTSGQKLAKLLNNLPEQLTLNF